MDYVNARMEKKTRRCIYFHSIARREKNIDIFGVFDGHGGKEIFEFVSNHFTEELIKNKNLESNFSQALKEAFIKMDEIMTANESVEEIKKYAILSKKADDLQSKNEQPNSQMSLLAQLMGPKEQEANDIFMRTGCTQPMYSQ